MRGASWIAIVLALWATPVFADPKAQAAAHYKQGKAFETAKQYPQAIAEYEAAYAIDKLPAHLFNIGNAAQLAGDLDKAIAYYQKYLDADGNGPRAKEARERIAEVTQKRADLEDKKKQDEAARQKALADDAARQEAERKRIAADGHVKLAEAYGRANEWSKAGDELRAAADADGDASHLRAAGDAYAKGKNHGKARDAYLAYLDKLPAAADADAIRDRVAAETRAMETLATVPTTPPIDRPRQTTFKRGWAGWGLQAGGGVSGASSNPLRIGEGSNGVDGGKTFVAAVDVRYAFARHVLLRPELAVRYQDVEFTGTMQGQSEKIARVGDALAVPVVLMLGSSDRRAELVAGPWVAVYPYVKSDGSGSMALNTDDFSRIDAGILLGLAVGFGDFAIQADYRRGLVGFESSFDTTLDTFTLGIGFRLIH
jgi:tetratricopeptide (TPR) repeat protein